MNAQSLRTLAGNRRIKLAAITLCLVMFTLAIAGTIKISQATAARRPKALSSAMVPTMVTVCKQVEDNGDADHTQGGTFGFTVSDQSSTLGSPSLTRIESQSANAPVCSAPITVPGSSTILKVAESVYPPTSTWPRNEGGYPVWTATNGTNTLTGSGNTPADISTLTGNVTITFSNRAGRTLTLCKLVQPNSIAPNNQGDTWTFLTRFEPVNPTATGFDITADETNGTVCLPPINIPVGTNQVNVGESFSNLIILFPGFPKYAWTTTGGQSASGAGATNIPTTTTSGDITFTITNKYDEPRVLNICTQLINNGDAISDGGDFWYLTSDFNVANFLTPSVTEGGPIVCSTSGLINIPSSSSTFNVGASQYPVNWPGNAIGYPKWELRDDTSNNLLLSGTGDYTTVDFAALGTNKVRFVMMQKAGAFGNGSDPTTGKIMRICKQVDNNGDATNDGIQFGFVGLEFGTPFYFEYGGFGGVFNKLVRESDGLVCDKPVAIHNGETELQIKEQATINGWPGHAPGYPKWEVLSPPTNTVLQNGLAVLLPTRYSLSLAAQINTTTITGDSTFIMHNKAGARKLTMCVNVMDNGFTPTDSAILELYVHEGAFYFTPTLAEGGSDCVTFGAPSSSVQSLEIYIPSAPWPGFAYGFPNYSYTTTGGGSGSGLMTDSGPYFLHPFDFANPADAGDITFNITVKPARRLTVCKQLLNNGDGIDNSGTFTLNRGGNRDLTNVNLTATEGGSVVCSSTLGVANYGSPTQVIAQELSNPANWPGNTPGFPLFSWTTTGGQSGTGSGNSAIFDLTNTPGVSGIENTTGDITVTFYNRTGPLRTLTLCKEVEDNGDGTPNQGVFTLTGGGNTGAPGSFPLTQSEGLPRVCSPPITIDPLSTTISALEAAPGSWPGNAAGFPKWTLLDGANATVTSGTGLQTGNLSLSSFTGNPTIVFRNRALHDLCPTITKSYFTNLSDTVDPNVTIDETVTFTLKVDLPEGSVPSLIVKDFIPPGMSVIGVTGKAGSGIPTANIPNPVITPTTVACPNPGGSPIMLTYGPINVPVDGNPNNNFVFITITAVVCDTPSNMGMPGSQTMLTNKATAQIGIESPNCVATSNPVMLSVVEPKLAITKTFEPATAKEGDMVTITLNVMNNGSSDAYNVIVEDPIPLWLFDTASITSCGTPPAGFTLTTPVVGGNTVVTFTGGNILKNQTVQFCFKGTIKRRCQGPSFNNVAKVKQAWTLPPGGGGGGGNRPTAPQDNDQGRDESGATGEAQLIITPALDCHCYGVTDMNGVTRPPNYTDMVEWLKFDEGTGNNAADSSIAGNNGTLNPASPNGPMHVSGLGGLTGNALMFDGINDSVVVPDSASLNFGTGSFTIDAWINPDPASVSANNTVQTILDKRKYLPPLISSTTGYALFLYNGRLGLQLASGTGINSIFNFGAPTTTPTIPANQWTHVAAVVTRTTTTSVTFYVNGLSIGNIPLPANFVIGSVNNLSPLYIGLAVPTDGSTFTGKIDEVEIFKIALEADTIAGIANAGSFGKCVPSPTSACCGEKPQWPAITFANFPSFGQVAIATRWKLNATDPVLVAIDLSNQSQAEASLIDKNWGSGTTPQAIFYENPKWARNDPTLPVQLGDVFGLTLDNLGNVYLAASSVYRKYDPSNGHLNGTQPEPSYKGTAGPGGIYKIDHLTADPIPFVFTAQATSYTPGNLIPNFEPPLGAIAPETYAPGLGNIAFDCARSMIYVSNFEDGLIYRIDASGPSGQILGTWDHGHNLPSALPPAPAINDDAMPGVTALGRIVFGLKTFNNRLYYSVQRNDVFHQNGAHNEIWSVGLDAFGAFVPPEKLEISLPYASVPGVATNWSSPVSDISFGPSGNMLLAERTMWSYPFDSVPDPEGWAHHSGVLEYIYSSGSWTKSGNAFEVGKTIYYGSAAPYAFLNAAGGIAIDSSANGRLWVTGDALHLPPYGSDVIYGLQGMPVSGTGPGNNTTNSLLIHLGSGKTQIGDVEIPCPAGGDCSGTHIAISPATLPNLSAGVNYTSPPFTASGGVAPYTFSATGLPPNLTMSANGVISGNLMQSGTFNNITVTVTDANGCTGTRNYSLTVICNSDISISPPTLPNGTVGTAYSQPFSAANGCGDFHFELVGGTLPPGMTLSATGVLSGTPTACGTYPFSIKATDKCGCSAIKPYTLVIEGVQTPMSDLFNTGVDNNHVALADGAADTHYSLILPGGSGATPVVTSPATVGLPWVANNAISNWIGFRPATIGDYTYITNFQLPANCVGFSAVINGQWAVDESAVMYLNGVQVASLPGTAATNYTVFHPFSITTNFQPGTNSLVIVVNNSTMSPTGLRVEMTGSYKCCPCQLAIGPDIIRGGAVGASYLESLLPIGGIAPYSFAITGGALPPGVSFSNGVLGGTPTAPGNYSFTAKLTDSAGCMTTRTYTIVVGCQIITVDPSTLRAGIAGVGYEQSLTQSGGVGTVTYSRTGGFLPPGLTLSAAGVLAGIPTTPGRSDFVVTATDANGCTAVSAYTMEIVCRIITLAPQALPGGSLGVAYNQTLTATGSAAPYTFTLVGGALPPGMSLNSTGVLSGTPTGGGNYSLAVKATDANGCTGVQSYILAICGTIISPATLSNGVVGVSYSQVLSPSDATAPVTWSVSAGSLPNGLTLNADTGVLSGTPTAFGTFNFSIRATDPNGCSGTRAYTVMVCAAINVNPATLPDGTAGTAYNQTFTQSGGSGSISWGVSAGSLPNGLTLSAAGLLSGTPTAAGVFTFTIQATDSNGCTGIRAYTLTIGCPVIAVNPATLPNGFAGSAYNQVLTASGGASPYSFTISAGALPGGMSLSSGGVLSGTPSAAGTFNFTAKATDTSNCIGVRAYTLTISGSGLQFYPLPAPVRALETRPGFNGCTAPAAPINATGTFTLAVRNACTGIPANAAAVTGNVTVVPAGPGYLTLFPSGEAQPVVANSNFKAGEITNNVFTVGLGSTDGAFKIFSSATTEVIVDITGFYTSGATSGLYFHVLPEPVRLVETRTFSGLTGCIRPGVPLPGNQSFVVQGRSPVAAPCNVIPATAQVLVGNATTVFPAIGGYLTAYASDAPQPLVASSNYDGGDVVNGPFAVKLGADGKFKVFTSATTDIVIDILGYYSADAVDANGTGLLFNSLAHPVRALETRPDFPGFPLTGCFRTNAPIPGGSGGIRTQQVWGTCDGLTIPNTARAIVGNVTVVNPVAAGYLTFYPGNVATAPTVATSNYPFPVIFGYNRHYFVGLSPTDGTFKILTSATTDMIVDVSGYFAP